MPSGVAAFLPGEFSAVVLGAFTTPYQPLLTPSWNTGVWTDPGEALAGQFTIRSNTPAPAPAYVVWNVVPAGATPTPSGVTSSLADYLRELRLMLHDPFDNYFPLASKVDCINRGIRQRDLDTEANRILQPFTLTNGLDTYDLGALGNPDVFDVVNINLIWVSTRIPLDQLTKVRLDVRWRQLIAAVDRPRAFARMGPTTVIFGPAPNLAYQTEWDCAVLSPALANLTDLDAVPYPYTKPVPFWAAYQLKLNEGKDDQAIATFQAQYEKNVNAALTSRTGLMSVTRGRL